MKREGCLLEQRIENSDVWGMTLYLYFKQYMGQRGLPQWLSYKEYAYGAGASGYVGWIPGLGRSPGGRPANPFQYSCLENPMNREAWQATFHVVAKSQTGLSTSQKHTIYGLL